MIGGIFRRIYTPFARWVDDHQAEEQTYRTRHELAEQRRLEALGEAIRKEARERHQAPPAP